MKEHLQDTLERLARGELTKEQVVQLLRQPKQAPPEPTSNGHARSITPAAPPPAFDLVAAVERELLELMAQHLKVEAAELDPTAPMEEFGFDSVGMNEFASALEARWSLDITPADFVQCDTIRALAQAFVRDHEAALRKQYEPRLPSMPDAPPSPTALHPLLDAADESRNGTFYKTIRGDEFFMRDHRFATVALLPGVAYLEMAWAAAQRSIAGDRQFALKNVVWVRPIRFEGSPIRVRIQITEAPSGGKFEIASEDLINHRWILCSQGKIVFDVSEPHPKQIDRKAAQSRTTSHLAKPQLYDFFRSRQFDYGPAFQAVQEVWANEREFLARLEIPPAAAHGFNEFQLHPSLLDASLQSGIAMVLAAADPAAQNAGLPFSVGRVELYRPLVPNPWVYGRRVETTANSVTNEGFLLDADGNVLAWLSGYVSRAIPTSRANNGSNGHPSPKNGAASNGSGSTRNGHTEPTSRAAAAPTLPAIQPGSESDTVVISIPEWVAAPVPGIAQELRTASVLAFVQDDVAASRLAVQLLPIQIATVRPGREFRALDRARWEIDPLQLDHYNRLFAELRAAGRVPSVVLHAGAFDKSIALSPAAPVPSTLVSLVNLAQAWLTPRSAGPAAIFHVHTEAHPSHDMVDGFLRSLGQEFPALNGGVLRVESLDDLPALWKAAPGAYPGISQFRVVEGHWETRRLRELNPTQSQHVALKSGGVYLITGGLGGLGQLLARDLAQKHRAKLVLCGRSQLSPEHQAFIRELQQSGAEVLYQPADVTDRNALSSLLSAARAQWGAIHGVFHCAGILRDGAFIRKTQAQFDEVLRPKLLGATHLDELTAQDRLDAFVLFSSVTSISGSRGQTDYASANRYLDAFAAWREAERRAHRRSGRTVSINWPLWVEGGMSMPAAMLPRMRAAIGMAPLPSAAGLAALQTALAIDASQVVVLYGDAAKLRDNFGIQPPAVHEPATASTPLVKAGITESEVVLMLSDILSRTLKIPTADLDPEADLGEFGLDSIVAMEVLNKCEEKLGCPVDPSAVFQFPTIAQLACHLAQSVSVRPPAETPESVREAQADPVVASVPSVNQSLHRATAPGTPSPIAVIGLSCRLPESPTIDSFWKNLREGRCLVGEVPASRWSIANHYSPNRNAPGKSNSKWAALLDDPYAFDNEFFKIGDVDARVMDPPHRIMLEIAEELFRDSGYTREEIRGRRIGVFVGGGESAYLMSNRDRLSEEELQHLVVNTTQNMMAARISDFYDIHGPAWTMDTACSSSMVAIHSACQSIRSGESEWAVAGGVHLLIEHWSHVAFSKAGVLAPDGVPRVFDRNSRGFVLGEGAGLVLLKPLDAALRDGDRIDALILSTAVNNDGHTMGITTPNQNAQIEVLKMAYQNAGVSPASLSYLEAHGTGTLLGDPIEIKAATEVFRQSSSEKQFCGVGSVKSNLGHCLRAAGITSVLKVILALRHREIPPTLNCAEPHPRFHFEESPFYPVRALQPFPVRAGVRRAAASSFGFGGTNCHIVFEGFDSAASRHSVRRHSLPPPVFHRRRFAVEAKPESIGLVDAAHQPSAAPASISPKPVTPSTTGHADPVVDSPSAQRSSNPPASPLATAVQAVPPITPPRPAAPLARPLLTATDLSAAIEQLLAERVAKHLDAPVHEIALETNFMDLGIDSVALVQLAQEVEKELQIELYPTLFFEYQNIRELSAYFTREHGERFAAFFGKSHTQPVPEPGPAIPASSPEVAPAPEATPLPVPSAATRLAPVATNGASSTRSTRVRDIAIIGMAGRFDSANNVDDLWRHLSSGADLIREVPEDHFDYRPWFDPHPQVPDKLYCKWGSFLDQVDRFDAGFFKVAEREAQLMDPQMRILLEVMQHTAESAGWAGRIRGTRTGVFVGSCFHDYGDQMMSMGKSIEAFDGTGNAASMLANRPSYFWNLRGPSMLVDTACSSSIVSLHLACQALRNGECDMAFAAGINLALGPLHLVYFCSIGALSPTGRCHTFDARADGYVPAEAIACVLLKPLDQAIADGDSIQAVIKGTAVNHGGYANTLTAPSPQLEAEVLVRAWEDAGIHPESLGYIEAHGTGTKLGDPVEIQGMKLAFQRYTSKTGFCAIGSAKAHLGHAEGAAGIVGIIKTVLSLRHRQIPALPDFKTLNPLIQLQNSPLYINSALQPWTHAPDGVLRAGVSSFGFGGTYGHAVLESYEAKPRTPVPPATPEILLFSARSPERLAALLEAWDHWLASPASAHIELRDIAATLQFGRDHFEHRLAFVARDHAELRARLDLARTGTVSPQILTGTASRNQARFGQTPEDIDYFRALATGGQLEKLAALWLWGVDIPWSKLYENTDRRPVPLPGYPFERRRYWHTDSGTTANAQPRPVQEGLLAEPDALKVSSPSLPGEEPAPPSASAPLPVPSLKSPGSNLEVAGFIRQSIAKLVRIPEARIQESAELTSLGFDSIMAMQLIRQLQETYGVRLYVNEAQLQPTFGGLVRYLAAQIPESPIADPPATPAQPVAPVFLLSAPRSGSTLLRVMLAGHSKLFCPPELHLLPFDDLAARASLLAGPASFLGEGLPRALVELKSCPPGEAVGLVNSWIEERRTTPEVYRSLASLAGGRLVIDKSPSYGENLDALKRSRIWFPDAKYILLVRHPLAVMESFVRNRFDKLLQRPGTDPWNAAEEVWLRTNRNLVAFRESLPPDRWVEVRYEDLVAAPQVIATRLCEFLGVPFEAALLKPYDGQRMTDGLHSVSISIGDPNFQSHQEIDPALSEGWRARLSEIPVLSPETTAVAAALGYDVPQHNSAGSRLLPAQREFLAHAGPQPIWNLEHRLRLQFHQPLDRARLETAVQAVVVRHPSLHGRFTRSGLSTWAAVKFDAAPSFAIDWQDFSNLAVADRDAALSAHLAGLSSALDLRKAPLLKLSVVDCGSSIHEWLFCWHHLIGDGRSSSIFLQEVLAEYESSQFRPKFEESWNSYAHAIEVLLDRSGAAHTEFWRDHLQGFTRTGLPLDLPGTVGCFSSEQEYRVPVEPSAMPSFEICAAALYRAVAEWTGSADVVLAHRFHGRRLQAKPADDPIGCFALDVPIRLKADTEAGVAQFRETFARLPASGITYLPLVLSGSLPPVRGLTGIRLNYQPWPILDHGPSCEVLSVAVRPTLAQDQPRDFAVDFIVRALPGGAWTLIVRYSELLHHESTIVRLAQRWRELIGSPAHA